MRHPVMVLPGRPQQWYNYSVIPCNCNVIYMCAWYKYKGGGGVRIAVNVHHINHYDHRLK